MDSNSATDATPAADIFVPPIDPLTSVSEDSSEGVGQDPAPVSQQAEGGDLRPSEVPMPYEGEAVENGCGGEERSRVLPDGLSRSVLHLECESSDGGVCDVYLVGTAHVSQESCREVQAVISYLKPQVVFLELCAGRIAILNPPQSFQHVPTVREMINMWKKNNMNALGVIYGWFLAKVANQLETLPGSEFRVAFQEAMSYGAKVILGDRPVDITLRRTWGKMSLWHKTKLMYYMLFQAVFLPSPEELNKMLQELDDVDMVTLVVQELSKQFPSLMETLVYERDMFMASKLLQVASDHSSVVAVVGKGHLPGIKKYWKQPIEVKHVLEIPPTSPFASAKMLASFSVAAGVAIISGIYIFCKR